MKSTVYQYQVAIETGEVHPGGNAMAQFRTEAAIRAPPKTTPVHAGVKYTAVKKKSATDSRKPQWGCWLCPSPDHYASNEKFHPRLKPGESHTLDEETKKKILDRVRAQTDLSATEKRDATTRIKDYWERRQNRGR